MANRERGELSMDIGGETYTMSLTIDTMVRLEDVFSTPEKPVYFKEIAEAAEKGSMKHTRAFVWAVLVENHPDLKLTDIGKLIAQGGGLHAFTNKLAQLAGISQPDARDLQSMGVSANPPQAQAGDAPRGTGARSTSKRAARA